MKKNQQGLALIEALVASAVLGIGLVGATQLMVKTIANASLNRQQTFAHQLAQEAMDCLRANAAACPAQETIERQGVRFTRQALSTPRGTPGLVDLQVSVQWSAAGTSNGLSSGVGAGSGKEPRIEWHSSVSGVPAWVGASPP
jgi:type IV pilus modification protein PilV